MGSTAHTSVGLNQEIKTIYFVDHCYCRWVVRVWNAVRCSVGVTRSEALTNVASGLGGGETEEGF